MKKVLLIMFLFLYTLLFIGCDYKREQKFLEYLQSNILEDIKIKNDEELGVDLSIGKALLQAEENYDVFVVEKNDKINRYICGYIDESSYAKIIEIHSKLNTNNIKIDSPFYNDSLMFSLLISSNEIIQNSFPNLYIDKEDYLIQWMFYKGEDEIKDQINNSKLISVFECLEYEFHNIKNNQTFTVNVLEENYDFVNESNITSFSERDYKSNRYLYFHNKSYLMIEEIYLEKKFDFLLANNAFPIEEKDGKEYLNIGNNTKVCNYSIKEYKEIQEKFYNGEVTYEYVVAFEKNLSDLKEKFQYKTKKCNDYTNYLFLLEDILSLLS